MEEKSNGQDDTGSIEDIGSELETLYEEVTGSNGIINLHNQRLNLKTRTANDMQDAIAKMETTSQQLDKVLLLGNQKADTIKKDVASTVSSSKISTIFITIISIVAAADWVDGTQNYCTAEQSKWLTQYCCNRRPPPQPSR